MSLEDNSTIHQNPPDLPPTLIPSYLLYEDRLVFTMNYQGPVKERTMHDNSIKNLESNKTNINISYSTRRQILRRVEAWVKSIKAYNSQAHMKKEKKPHYPIMLTLTLSSKQIHSDQDIKRKILMPFLKQLLRTQNIFYYFWRAEAQENGNIHFHLLIDAYVRRDVIQRLWNKYQDKLGYVQKFQKKHGHSNPPSTQIKGADNWYNFYRYMTKYLTKDEKYRNIEGRKWMMSRALKDITIYKNDVDYKLEDRLIQLEKEGKIQVYRDEWFTVAIFDKFFDLRKEIPWLWFEADTYYLHLYETLYEKIPRLEVIDEEFARLQ